MMKYEILKDDSIEYYGHTLYRIRSLINIFDKENTLVAEAGELGGYLENETNLSQVGGCWLSKDSKVYDNVEISEEAFIYNSIITGDTKISDQAGVYNTSIYGVNKIFGKAEISTCCIRNCIIGSMTIKNTNEENSILCKQGELLFSKFNSISDFISWFKELPEEDKRKFYYTVFDSL